MNESDNKKNDEQPERISGPDKMGVYRDGDWIDIPSGEFLMGSPAAEAERSYDEPQHSVTIDAFKLLRTPVTYFMYEQFCKATGVKMPEYEGVGLKDSRPVTNISYWDATEYARWLSQETGWNCVLPTEAQWEYACRAGTKTAFYTGDNICYKDANYNSEIPYNNAPKAKNQWSDGVIPVAFYKANAWGLYDMIGNINE